jgi:replicative DNA helicase
VAVFSLEMNEQQLTTRLVSGLSRIDGGRLQNPGRLTEEEWARLPAAIGMIREAPIFVDDTPSLSPVELRSRSAGC